MKNDVEQSITTVVKELFGVDAAVELTRPDEQFGDYATNVALKLAGKVGKNPREIADELAEKLREKLAGQISEVSVAGPGFLNIKLSDDALVAVASAEPAKPYADKVIVAEYSDPNPFKVLHAGHLYTSVVGDAIASLLENAGAQVHRVNYGGDVGLHVGKTMWAILQKLGGENPEQLSEINSDKQAEWMADAYVTGTNAYEDDPAAKEEIVRLNKEVYRFHTDDEHSSPLAQIYWTCREWSYEYFNRFYDRIGTHFEKYYPESEVAPIGLTTVHEHTGSVYKESEGAVIFDGEPYGLHARVFISSQGLPTYEAKEVGLMMKKWSDYRFDLSVYITGNEIDEYMKVVFKSIEQFQPDLVKRSRHLTHGMVKLAGGVKMSSRKGNILRATDVLDAAAEANKKLHDNEDERTTLGAVKYAFLKNRIGGDIIYDPAESVSLQGNSGPYLQYAHARARSILSKTSNESRVTSHEFEPGERSLLRKLGEYSEVVEQATNELMPHHICTYLYELAQKFNSFYEHNRVLGDTRQDVRLQLVQAYADTLKSGLEILGIAAPDKM